MALDNHSKFYYGIKVTTENRYLDFIDHSASTKVATLPLGSYTPTEFADLVSTQINKVVTTGAYTVTFNRSTKLFTIDSGVYNITVLFATGLNNVQGCYDLLGYNKANFTITASTKVADYASIKEYKTQFYIQSYLGTDYNRKAIDGVINKSASGVIEVIKFGNERFLNGELLFITDLIQENNSIVRTNPNGVGDYIELIEWLTEKYPVEIMINENLPNEYQTLTLESTEQDSKGLDYELIELYDRSLPLYYRSGKLKFRLME